MNEKYYVGVTTFGNASQERIERVEKSETPERAHSTLLWELETALKGTRYAIDGLSSDSAYLETLEKDWAILDAAVAQLRASSPSVYVPWDFQTSRGRFWMVMEDDDEAVVG